VIGGHRYQQQQKQQKQQKQKQQQQKRHLLVLPKVLQGFLLKKQQMRAML